MTFNKLRQQGKSVHAIGQTSNISEKRAAINIQHGIVQSLRELMQQLLGAVDDHRNWIPSDRARALESAFEISGRLLGYAAFFAIAYLVLNSVLDIRHGLGTGLYRLPESGDDARVALFNILAGGLIGPIVVAAIGFGVGWVYNLTTAAANQALPRFARTLIRPIIIVAVAAAYAAMHSMITATAAIGWLHVKTNIDAALPKNAGSQQTFEALESNDKGTGDAMRHESVNDRELARLKSIFHDSRPCLEEKTGVDINSPTEASRPQPGLAPNRACDAEIRPNR